MGCCGYGLQVCTRDPLRLFSFFLGKKQLDLQGMSAHEKKQPPTLPPRRNVQCASNRGRRPQMQTNGNPTISLMTRVIQILSCMGVWDREKNNVQVWVLSNCSHTLIVQRSATVTKKRPTRNLTGDTSDPNSLLHGRVGPGANKSDGAPLELQMTRSSWNGAPVSGSRGWKKHTRKQNEKSQFAPS